MWKRKEKSERKRRIELNFNLGKVWTKYAIKRKKKYIFNNQYGNKRKRKGENTFAFRFAAVEEAIQKPLSANKEKNH